MDLRPGVGLRRGATAAARSDDHGRNPAALEMLSHPKDGVAHPRDVRKKGLRNDRDSHKPSAAYARQTVANVSVTRR